MFQKIKKNIPATTRRRLVRLTALAVLLAVVILAQTIPGWGDAYARHVYPVVGELLSDLSGPVPFAVGVIERRNGAPGCWAPPNTWRGSTCGSTWPGD